MKTEIVRQVASLEPRRRRLAMLALLALAAYVLACRPGFSPDGTKILVSTLGGPQKQGHLLAYDRKTGKWLPLLTVSGNPSADEVHLLSANWSNNGKEVVAAWAAKEDQLSVAVLSVGGQGGTRLFRVDGINEALSTLVVPPVVHRQHVLFGGNAITVMDLETGATTQQPLEGNEVTNAPRKSISLVGQGGGVYYLLGGGTNLEAGRLDISDLSHPRPVPFLHLDTGQGDVSPFLALSRVNSRLALTRGDVDGQRLEIYRNNSLERTMRFGTTNNGIILGNLVWAPDGRTLYAAGFRPLQPGPIAKAIHAGYDALRKVGVKATEPPPLDLQVLACEITMGSGSVLETPLFRVSSARDETFLTLYQIALAPDGGTIAASAGIASAEQGTREGDRALYLIDLTRASRPVSKVLLPRATVTPAGVD